VANENDQHAYSAEDAVVALGNAALVWDGDEGVMGRALRVADFALDLDRNLLRTDSQLPSTPDLRQATALIAGALRTLTAAGLVVQEQGAASRAISDRIEMATQDLELGLRDWITTRKASLKPSDLGLLNVLSRFEERFETRRLAEEVQDVHDEVVRVLSDTQDAAGKAGSTSLGVHFGDYATKEKRTADLLRSAAIALLLLITGIAATLLESEPKSLNDLGEAARLSLTVPLAVLAAYLGREASHHRATSRWARNLEVQLRSVNAYTEPLSPELRDMIRAELGRRVFSAGLDEAVQANGNAPSAVGEVTGLLERVTGLMRTAERPDAPRGA
jgi:hypothetical protein